MGAKRPHTFAVLVTLAVGCAPAPQGESTVVMPLSTEGSAMLVNASQVSAANPLAPRPLDSQAGSIGPQPEFIEPHPGERNFRGWDYLVGRLADAGVPERDLVHLFSNPRMPQFTFVPFALRPKETSSMYSGFATKRQFMMGASFSQKHATEFDRMERVLNVPREVVTAILVIESQLGANTGNHSVLYRLSRVASAGDPANVHKNYLRLRETDSSVTLAALEARAAYLEKTFLPEIPALIEIGKRNGIDVHHVKGSVAGAFGLPQFLPSAFLRYGIDGDRDGYVSLYNEVDSLWSAGNYLGSYGYRDSLPVEEKRNILWKYNKSDAYIDTVLAVAAGINQLLR